MPRKGPSEERRRELAIAASRRLVSQGPRPLFRVRVEETELGIWVSDEVLGIGAWAQRVSDATMIGRREIARVLEVDPDRFDVELERGLD